MRILGAILAGGEARRFGSDKARAEWNGKPLMDWVAEALEAQCEKVVVCGRVEEGFSCLSDQPEPGLGPLGGLYAALCHASENGFSHVLSAGVDAPNLPHDLVKTLDGKGAAIVESQPVAGLWPAEHHLLLAAFLAEDRRALYGFAERVKARRIALDPPLLNINRPKDLGENS
ncbi:MAG: molybdenum cofactor guanylyltransferase [Pseudomonadota bacterium]